MIAQLYQNTEMILLTDLSNSSCLVNHHEILSVVRWPKDGLTKITFIAHGEQAYRDIAVKEPPVDVYEKILTMKSLERLSR